MNGYVLILVLFIAACAGTMAYAEFWSPMGQECHTRGGHLVVPHLECVIGD